jgi:5-methylcytosine-specific restriction enzyme A
VEPTGRRSRPWSRDEIVLACSLVAANGWHELRTEYPEVIDLSRVLRALSSDRATNDSTFRSPASVARKTADIATQHDSYRGKPTRENRLDGEVLREFVSDPAGMASLAPPCERKLCFQHPMCLTWTRGFGKDGCSHGDI